METLTDIQSEAWARFHDFDRKNPDIYIQFRRVANTAIMRGHKHLSSELIINQLRWESPASAKNDPYKIPNWIKPFYARRFMREYPHYAGFFRTKTGIADIL